MGFFLDSDNDGHWYVISVKMRKQWQTWCDLSGDDPSANKVPSWALPVDSHDKVIFPSFTVPE